MNLQKYRLIVLTTLLISLVLLFKYGRTIKKLFDNSKKLLFRKVFGKIFE